MRTVEIGTVVVFDNPQANKEQALKVLEEAAEVVEAFKMYDGSLVPDCWSNSLINEIADTIQACANLSYAIGYEDMQPRMDLCKVRNIERGRITPDEPEPEPELKPCPFCGGEATLDEDGIRCSNPECELDAMAIIHDSKEAAIELWNTRAGEENE